MLPSLQPSGATALLKAKSYIHVCLQPMRLWEALSDIHKGSQGRENGFWYLEVTSPQRPPDSELFPAHCGPFCPTIWTRFSDIPSEQHFTLAICHSDTLPVACHLPSWRAVMLPLKLSRWVVLCWPFFTPLDSQPVSQQMLSWRLIHAEKGLEPLTPGWGPV